MLTSNAHRTSVLCLALLLAIVPLASAKDLRSSKPKREGVSAERLARIDAHMEQQVAEGVMVGGQGMIARNGRVVYDNTWGMSDREAGKPMTKDTIHRIYSMTKPVTGVALMMLYEEGKFFLNDPVAKYIPELANLEVALSTADSATGVASDGTASIGSGAGDENKIGQTREPARQPTIRDLMRHTGGFTYGIFGETEVDALYREANVLGQPDSKAFIEALGKLPLQYEPGTRWHYSVSVDIQGYLVEVLSGMSLGEFMQQRIFEPLDMDDTSFRISKEKLPRLAQLYSPVDTEAGLDGVWRRNESLQLEVADPRRTYRYIHGGGFDSGGGGLPSTAEDYMRFCLMLLHGGELDGASARSIAVLRRAGAGGDRRDACLDKLAARTARIRRASVRRATKRQIHARGPQSRESGRRSPATATRRDTALRTRQLLTPRNSTRQTCATAQAATLSR